MTVLLAALHVATGASARCSLHARAREVMPARMQVVRRIEVPVREVKWAESGELVTIVSDSSFYVLRFDRSAFEAVYQTGEDPGDDGVEDAFELLNEVAETVRTGERPRLCPSGITSMLSGGMLQTCRAGHST